MTLQELTSLEGFLLSDRVTIKGGEFMALGQLVSAVQRDKAALANAEMVARRAAPVAVPKTAE